MNEKIFLSQLQEANRLLLDEAPQYRAAAAEFPADRTSQRRLLRSLMNVRMPRAVPERFLRVQDALLAAERAEKGVVDVRTLAPTARDSRLVLWQGDITRLNADAIVNAANDQLLGCFVPCHGCIDNAIHSAAGLQLREACAELMRAQGAPEPTGRAKITPGFNLPAKHVLHTVGPIIRGPLTQADCDLLRSCYESCLRLADAHGLKSVAFCCISTGEFHFPKERAAEIAVETVQAVLDRGSGIERVIFNVFGDEDAAIYRTLLGG